MSEQRSLSTNIRWFRMRMFKRKLFGSFLWNHRNENYHSSNCIEIIGFCRYSRYGFCGSVRDHHGHSKILFRYRSDCGRSRIHSKEETRTETQTDRYPFHICQSSGWASALGSFIDSEDRLLFRDVAHRLLNVMIMVLLKNKMFQSICQFLFVNVIPLAISFGSSWSPESSKFPRRQQQQQQ